MGELKESAEKAEPVDPPATAVPEAAAKKKLSYKLQRELDAIPGQIDALEAELAALQGETASPTFYQRPQEEARIALERLASLQQDLDRLIERWAELEEQ
ncbi:ABC transporter ATP-binding protein uup [compost metagenome]